jgi:hypothetical protein
MHESPGLPFMVARIVANVMHNSGQSPGPIGPGPPAKGSPCREVLCAPITTITTLFYNGLRGSDRLQAKGPR